MPKDLAERHAVLYRMALPDHLCPSGLKARWLLRREGYEVEDRLLTSRDAVDAFKAEHGVRTTPQAFIAGERVGGYSDLRVRIGRHDPSARSYAPVAILFVVALGTALSLAWFSFGDLLRWQTLGWFVSISMILLGMQKLRDVESFTTMFLGYDIAARAWVPYAYIYPWVETVAGILMTGMILTWLAAPAALVISTIGAVSVYRAVYVEKRDLRCACTGGGTNVPLGPVSLAENLMMMAMSVMMLVVWVGG